MTAETIILIAIVAAFSLLAVVLFFVAWWSNSGPAAKPVSDSSQARRPTGNQERLPA
ncbi:MAG: hypothetical protein K1X35_07260 [Caulobacteraceae bacterium]|nr:hypothetical protein [Caulobacteraceae bacterium]